jgi:hypothetical protein
MGHSRQRGHADAGSTPRASFRADERTAARRVEHTVRSDREPRVVPSCAGDASATYARQLQSPTISSQLSWLRVSATPCRCPMLSAKECRQRAQDWLHLAATASDFFAQDARRAADCEKMANIQRKNHSVAADRLHMIAKITVRAPTCRHDQKGGCAVEHRRRPTAKIVIARCGW